MALQQCLIELSTARPDLYAAVYWFYYEDLSHREIAARCGTTIGNAKMRCLRAREYLKECLENRIVQEKGKP
jgi:DNA-directed RNA polymerase specialized sigma24 family protein